MNLHEWLMDEENSRTCLKIAATSKAVGTVLLATATLGPIGGIVAAGILGGTYVGLKKLCEDGNTNNRNGPGPTP